MDDTTPLSDTRKLQVGGDGSICTYLMMSALRREGLGPDADGAETTQHYLPDEGVIVVDLRGDYTQRTDE